jgi:hypothetical protein
MKRIKIPIALIVHIVFIIGVYILQAMVFVHLPIRGCVPVLLPIAVVGLAIFEGPASGGGYGLLAGMLCDISFNQPALIMTVVLTVLGIVVGILSETILARGFPGYFICCVGGLVLTAFVSIFSLVFFAGVSGASLLGTAINQTVYSAVFTFPLYFIVRALGRHGSRV